MAAFKKKLRTQGSMSHENPKHNPGLPQFVEMQRPKEVRETENVLLKIAVNAATDYEVMVHTDTRRKDGKTTQSHRAAAAAAALYHVLFLTS